MIDALIAARTVHFAATATVTGVTIFRGPIIEAAFHGAGAGCSGRVQAYRRKLNHILWYSLALVILAGGAWLMALAADIAGRPSTSISVWKTSWILLTETQFGHAWIARLGLSALLIGSLSLETWKDTRSFHRHWLTVFLTMCLMGSLTWSGHAAGTPGLAGDVHVTADFLHLVAAGAWLGGLLPFVLLMALAGAKTDLSLATAVQKATLRFSTLGVLSVGTLLVTGLVNTWMLAGNLAALLDTTYGRLLLAKIALFIAMVGIATVNRLRLTRGLPAVGTMRHLKRNAIVEIGLGLLIVGIVGVLGVLPPAEHATMRMH